MIKLANKVSKKKLRNDSSSFDFAKISKASRDIHRDRFNGFTPQWRQRISWSSFPTAVYYYDEKKETSFVGSCASVSSEVESDYHGCTTVTTRITRTHMRSPQITAVIAGSRFSDTPKAEINSTVVLKRTTWRLKKVVGLPILNGPNLQETVNVLR